MATPENYFEERTASIHAKGSGKGFQGQGAATISEIKRKSCLPEPYRPGKYRFSHNTSLPNVEQDRRMVEDPNHPSAYFERVMLDGTGPHAKRLHGN